MRGERDFGEGNETKTTIEMRGHVTSPQEPWQRELGSTARKGTNDYERAVIARCSDTGLKRNEIDRRQKRDHLLGSGFPKSSVEEVLDKLYGSEGQ